MRIKRKKIGLARFMKQTGAIGTTIMLIGLGLTLWGFHTMRGVAEEAKAKHIDVTSPDVVGQEKAMDKINPNKVPDANRANVMKVAVEGGKTVIGTAAPIHDGGVLTAYDKMVGFTVDQKTQDDKKAAKEARNRETEEKLKERGLPSDKLSVDVTERVQDVVMENSPSSAKGDLLGSIKEISDKKTEELLKKGTETGSVGNSTELKQSIKTELNEKDVLEDQRIIDNKKELQLETQKKGLMNKISDTYTEYSNRGLISLNQDALDSYNNDIKQAENKIAALDSSIKEQEEVISTSRESSTGSGETGSTEVIESGSKDQQQEEGSAEEEETVKTDDSGIIEEDNTVEVREEKTILKLNGTIAGGKGTVYMTIYLDTGRISGRFVYRDKAGECNVLVDEGISGNIDLDTKKITAYVSGTAYYSGTEDYCNTTNPFTDKLTGYLSKDNSSASGQCTHGESWHID